MIPSSPAREHKLIAALRHRPRLALGGRHRDGPLPPALQARLFRRFDDRRLVGVGGKPKRSARERAKVSRSNRSTSG